jgi:hypothetical protein
MEFEAPSFNLLLVLPVLIIMVWAILLMIVDLLLPEDKKRWIPWLALIGIAVGGRLHLWAVHQ